MSPSNAAIYVENIRKALVKMDPANEATYNANAATYTAKIKALDEPVRHKLAAIPRDAALAGEQRGSLLLPHRANYGLKQLYLLADQCRRPRDAPQQVRKVIDSVREHKIPVVF